MNNIHNPSLAPSLSPVPVPHSDSRSGDRLIVLLPYSGIDTPAMAQRIWGIARSFQLNVLLISLFDHPDSEPQLRRHMINLVAMIQDPNISIDTVIAHGRDWVEQVERVCRPGDIVACYAGHRVGILRKPLQEILHSDLDMPVHVLTGSGNTRTSRSSFLSKFFLWAGSLAIIGGFFWVQVKLLQLPHDWGNNALIVICMFMEIPLILIWTSRFA